MYKTRKHFDSNFGVTSKILKIVPIIILVIIVGSGYIYYCNNSNVAIVNKCKIIELKQQTLISGQNKNISTEIRYLIITDKETFICETSFLNSKYNNSDIFW